MHGLCQCGCGQKTRIAPQNHKARGWVRGEPIRFCHGHQSKKLRQYEADPDTGCWNWLLAMSREEHGYPVVTHNYVQRLAHRVYYEEFVGPIPDGWQVDHVCQNTRCVNPDHLEAVTHEENARRRSSTKLTWNAVRDIRESEELGTVLAARYGVTPDAVYLVRSGQRWVEEAA